MLTRYKCCTKNYNGIECPTASSTEENIENHKDILISNRRLTTAEKVSTSFGSHDKIFTNALAMKQLLPDTFKILNFL